MTRRDLKTLVDMLRGSRGYDPSGSQNARGHALRTWKVRRWVCATKVERMEIDFVHTYASNKAVNPQIVNPQRLY
jgi:hypothetical protein